MPKVVNIVGAGPGGLASAVLLAASGVKVRLFERLPFVGGRTSTIEAEGFKFDLGPTFFLYPRILDEILMTAGTRLHREVEMVKLDPQYRIIFGEGGKLDATPRIEAMEKEIATLAPGDSPGFSRFLTENRKKMGVMEPVLEQAFLGWKDLLQSRLLKALPLLHPLESIETYLKRFFQDPRVRLAFCFQSKYLGMSPFRCPSLFSILSFLEYEHGVWHPMGGCGAVSKALAAVAERLGVEVHLESPVQRLMMEGKKVVGLVTPSGEYKADATVINADFARAMQRLVPNSLRPSWNDRTIQRKQFSCSTFMMYLGIEGREELPHHTIHISSEYEQNLKDIDTHYRLSEDPSFYVQNACVTDPGLAPSGQSTLYVLAPVPHQNPNIDWAKEKTTFRAKMVRQLSKLGIKNLESRIRYERIVTPLQWDTQYEIHLGATFNLAHTLRQMLHLRPRNRFEDLDRVYLVGGGTHPGSGLPVIFESARITSRLLLEDLDLALPQSSIVPQGSCSRPSALQPA